MPIIAVPIARQKIKTFTNFLFCLPFSSSDNAMVHNSLYDLLAKNEFPSVAQIITNTQIT